MRIATSFSVNQTILETGYYMSLTPSFTLATIEISGSFEKEILIEDEY